MAKYTVWGYCFVGMSMEVEAEDADGNSGTDQLVGINDRSISLSADGSEELHIDSVEENK